MGSFHRRDNAEEPAAAVRSPKLLTATAQSLTELAIGRASAKRPSRRQGRARSRLASSGHASHGRYFLNRGSRTRARANGRIGDDTALTAVGDAITEFQPDHILVALRSREHANGQGKGLIERIRDAFSLPLTTYAVDPQGHD
jgi:hypothetical protein